MANHKSAAKRARQTETRTARNSKRRASVRTAEKKVRIAIENKDKKAGAELLRSFAKSIDTAAQKGIVDKKRASRRISRLSQQLSQI